MFVLEGMEGLKFVSITLLSVLVGFGRKLLLGMLDYSTVSKEVKKFLPADFLLGLTVCVYLQEWPTLLAPWVLSSARLE